MMKEEKTKREINKEKENRNQAMTTRALDFSLLTRGNSYLNIVAPRVEGWTRSYPENYGHYYNTILLVIN